MRTAKLNEPFSDCVSVVGLDMVSLHSGLGSGDFTVTFLRDGTAQTPTYTVTETAAPGTYQVSLPGGFPSIGTWLIRVQIPYNGSIWQTHVEVRRHDADDVYDVVIAGGSGTESVSCMFVDQVHSDAPIPDLLVNVYDQSGTVFVTFGRTNASGVRTFLLDQGTYVLRVYKPGISSEDLELVVEEGGGSVTFQVNAIFVAPPPSPRLCRIYADFVALNGVPLVNFKVRFDTVFSPTSSGWNGVGQPSTTAITNSQGHLEVDVVRGTRIKASLVGTPFVREFLVPDEATSDLLTLLALGPDAFRIRSAPG